MDYNEYEKRAPKRRSESSWDEKFLAFFLGSCVGIMTTFFLGFVCIILFVKGIWGVVEESVNSVGNLPSLLEQTNSTVTTTFLPEYSVFSSDDSVEDNKIIAIIDIYGVIMQGKDKRVAGSDMINDLLRSATNDEIAAIVLNINSPGGEVTASDEIYRVVQEIREKHKIPVVTCMRSVCASGGYYIAAASDWIVANPTTITGSIGVIFHSYNYHQLMDKVGVQSEVYKSGEMKDVLNGARERTDVERKLIQDLVDENYLQFATIVAKGRKNTFASAEEVKNHPFVGDARILSGKQAFEVGLVDELGTLKEAVKAAKKLAKATPGKAVSVYRYHNSGSVLDDLFSFKMQNNVINQLVPFEGTALKPGYNYYILPTILY